MAILTNGFPRIAAPRSGGKPAATFPGGVAGDAQLAIAVNREQGTLASTVGISDTSMTVQNIGGIVIWSLLSIDNEIVQVNGAPSGNVIPISRGFDGTTPAMHLAGATVSGLVDAYHHNTLVAEVEAIEAALGPNLSRIPAATTLTSTAYTFPPQFPGGTLTPGTNSITLAPVPQGVNGTDQNHYLYVDQGTGTAEPVLITGGSAVSGAASGTLFITCANAHSGAWRISTATSGIQEAVVAGGATPGVSVPPGSYTNHAPVTLPINSAVSGGFMYGTVINVAADFPVSLKGVFVGPAAAGAGPQITGLIIQFIQPDSTSIAGYTHWPPAFYMVGTARFDLEKILVVAAWDVVNMTGNAGGSTITELYASHFGTGIRIDGSLDSVYLTKVRFWPYGLTSNQNTLFNDPTNGTVGLYSARVDDLCIVNFFSENPVGIHFASSSSGVSTASCLNVSFDSFGTLVIDDGYLKIINFAISVGTFTHSGIVMNAGNVKISNGEFYPGTGIGTNQPWIQHNGGILQLSNCWFWSGGVDINSVISSGGALIVHGCYFNRAPNVAYSYPTISITGTSRATIVGNRTIDKGTGAGTFISVASDGYHQVRGNTFLGYAASFPLPAPGSQVEGCYEDDVRLYANLIQSSQGYNYGNIGGASGSIPSTATITVKGGIITSWA